MLMNLTMPQEIGPTTHLIITEQPDAGCLVVLVVRDHNVVRSYLQQVAVGHLDLAIATPHPPPISSFTPNSHEKRTCHSLGCDNVLRRRPLWCRSRLVLILQVLLHIRDLVHVRDLRRDAAPAQAQPAHRARDVAMVVVDIGDVVDVADMPPSVPRAAAPRVRLDPLLLLAARAAARVLGVREGQQPLGVFVRVRVRERARAPEARHAPREEVLLISGKVVARLRRIACLPAGRIPHQESGPRKEMRVV